MYPITYLAVVVIVTIVMCTLAATIFEEEDSIRDRLLSAIFACAVVFMALPLMLLFQPEETVWDYNDTKEYRLATLTSWYSYAPASTNELILKNDNTYYFEIYDGNALDAFATKEYAIPSDQVDIEFEDGFGRLVVTQVRTVKRRRFLFLCAESDGIVGQPTYTLIVPEGAIINTQP